VVKWLAIRSSRGGPLAHVASMCLRVSSHLILPQFWSACPSLFGVWRCMSSVTALSHTRISIPAFQSIRPPYNPGFPILHRNRWNLSSGSQKAKVYPGLLRTFLERIWKFMPIDMVHGHSSGSCSLRLHRLYKNSNANQCRASILEKTPLATRSSQPTQITQ
jgi:hypothetical protein